MYKSNESSKNIIKNVIKGYQYLKLLYVCVFRINNELHLDLAIYNCPFFISQVYPSKTGFLLVKSEIVFFKN